MDSDALNILFCGSDAVSTESLHALHEQYAHNREIIQDIQVVVPPPKMTGRGLKQKSEGESRQSMVFFFLLSIQAPV
jgi:methionyl-tRNA formyltransferase